MLATTPSPLTHTQQGDAALERLLGRGRHKRNAQLSPGAKGWETDEYDTDGVVSEHASDTVSKPRFLLASCWLSTLKCAIVSFCIPWCECLKGEGECESVVFLSWRLPAMGSNHTQSLSRIWYACK